ncbi:hypothetical protein [Rhizobium sp. 9140]|uniref:hypothetical protein n=1 Tax=Rhizobium sp. 9140 TaxID=1761900 RepID=UPI00079AE062|nr:hypothetical protein [Rhizobium sp. 9140]CZT33008.1 hypothetical protein GA0004734_00000360 [Rhizobium sp. 9140]
MNEVKEWLSLIAIAISLATAVWAWISAPSKKTASDLDLFRKTATEEMKILMEAVTELGRRTQTLEGELKHLPDAKAFMDMRLAIEQQTGKLGRMEESLTSTSRTVLQVQDYLLKKSNVA